MKKLRGVAVPALLALLLLAGCDDSGAERWVLLVAIDEMPYYIDRASIQKTSDNRATAWLRRGNGNYLIFDLSLLEFDFSDRTYRELAYSSYFKFPFEDEWELLDSSNTPTEWHYFKPESVVDAAYLKLKRWLKM